MVSGALPVVYEVGCRSHWPLRTYSSRTCPAAGVVIEAGRGSPLPSPPSPAWTAGAAADGLAVAAAASYMRASASGSVSEGSALARRGEGAGRGSPPRLVSLNASERPAAPRQR